MLLLNVEPEVRIRRRFTKPMQVTGVHGLVSATLGYRVKSAVANSAKPEGCEHLPPLYETDKSEYVSYSTGENPQLQPALSPSSLRPPDELPNTEDAVGCDCILKEDATQFAVCCVMLTCASLSLVFPVVYSLLQLLMSTRIPYVKQTILEKFIEEGLSF